MNILVPGSAFCKRKHGYLIGSMSASVETTTSRKLTLIIRPSVETLDAPSRSNAAVARAISYDNFIWSTPGVTLAAHAFLFSIALGGVNSQSSRIVSGQEPL